MKRLGMALVLALLLAAVARAAEPAESIWVQWGINEDGRGHVLANPMPDGSWGSITWQACAPDGTCSSVAPSPDNDKILDVGGSSSSHRRRSSVRSAPVTSPGRCPRPGSVAGETRGRSYSCRSASRAATRAAT